MLNVQHVNRTQPPDWNPDRRTIARLLAAVNREAYPPRQRTGVGALTRPPAH